MMECYYTKMRIYKDSVLEIIDLDIIVTLLLITFTLLHRQNQI